MSMPVTETRPARRTSLLIGWGMVAGGALLLAGGQLHPKEDPPGVSLKEHLRIMFEDPAWYPAHALLLVSSVLIAASLLALARDRDLARVPRAHAAVVVAAVAATANVLGMLLHLVAAVDHDRIAAGASVPLTNVDLVVETITVPAFGLAMAALAVIGAATRTLGNWVTAVIGALGGIGFALAGATFLFTDKLDPLFPAAAGIGLWVLATGIGIVRRGVTAFPSPLRD